MAEAKQRYCYHCKTYHDESVMKELSGKSGKRWRCLKSIDATKGSRAERDAFGAKITEINKQESRVIAARTLLARQTT